MQVFLETKKEGGALETLGGVPGFPNCPKYQLPRTSQFVFSIQEKVRLICGLRIPFEVKREDK